MTRFLDQTRERFLLAIAAQLPAERFIELHFFHPIRQGGIESGVAVVAAYPESQPEIVVGDAPPQDDRQGEGAPQDDTEAGGAPREDLTRYTVYSARYKLVLKGSERGKWECSVVAEADAPLVTVASVVRGVQRRAGDAEEPERMSGDEARDYVLAATGGSAA